MRTIETFAGELPASFFTVIPYSDPDTEIGPFATRKEANDFGALHFLMQASVREYRDMRLTRSEEISAEEYARLACNPKTRGFVDPATF